MALPKYIEIKVFINKPELARYEFSIYKQSHRGKEFGDFGCMDWCHNGFKIISSSYPYMDVANNRLYVRGNIPKYDHIRMYTGSEYSRNTIKIRYMNNWFDNMIKAIDIYNLQLYSSRRINILHKPKGTY